MIDSLEYYLNRDEHGNLRTQGEPQPIDEGDLDDPLDDEEDDDDAIDRKYRGEED